MKITAHTIIQNSCQTTIIHPFTATYPYNHTYIIQSLKTKFIIWLIKIKKKIITYYIIMSDIAIWNGGWQTSESTPRHSWRNPTRWEIWDQVRPCVPFHRLIIQKFPKGTLMDNRPTKMVKITKGGLFDTLPMEILYIIDDCVNSFEYNDKCIAVTNRIKSPKNPVSYKLP